MLHIDGSPSVKDQQKKDAKKSRNPESEECKRHGASLLRDA
jgi:hypothetical protein